MHSGGSARSFVSDRWPLFVAHHWLGRHLLVTRFALYAAAIGALTLALVIAIVVVRRGLHGLPLWSLRIAHFAMRSSLPIVVIALMGPAIDWALRRREWWAHAIAGGFLGPAWVVAMGLTAPRLVHAAIGAALLVFLGRFGRGYRLPDAPPIRPTPDSPPQMTDGEFAQWGRSWDENRRRSGRPINAMLAAIVVVAVALNLWVFPRFMSRGWAAAAMLLVLAVSAIVAARIAVRRQSRLIRELGRSCSACRSIIDDPQAVIQGGGKCRSCGSALYIPA